MNLHDAKYQLLKAGYLVKRCSEYHLQVKLEGKKQIVNLWPTANKILKEFAPGPAAKFNNNDLIRTVDKLLKSSLKMQAEELRRLYPIIGDKEAQGMVYEWREGGLSWLKHTFNLQ